LRGKKHGKRLLRFALVIFSLFFIASGLFAAESNEDLKKYKAQVLTEKALRAHNKGKIEEAVEAFEDAYEIYPSNVNPLLLLSETLCRVGLYSRANSFLAKIPINSLPLGGQAKVHMLFGKIALASGTPEIAAVSFKEVLKIQPTNSAAKIRLAMVAEWSGRHEQAVELMEQVKSFENVDFRDRVMAFLLDAANANFARAWENCGEMAEILANTPCSEDDLPFLSGLWQNQIPCFIANLPLGLAGVTGTVYLLLFLIALSFLASRLTPESPFMTDLGFIILATVHIMLFRWIGIQDFRISTLLDGFEALAPKWIVPRQLCGMHFVTLGLFIIFPIFRLLPQTFRPRRSELYGIWFFCFWFMVFVLVFQSKLTWEYRGPIMLSSFLLTGISAFMMPLGRYLFFLVAKPLGAGAIGSMAEKNLSGGEIGFTDAKIQEAKALRLLENDDFDQVIVIGNKILKSLDKKAFPTLWISLIKAYLEKEDLYESNREIKEFLETFEGSSIKDKGLLLSAVYKVITADFAGALAIINEIAEERAKSFSNEETAISLLIIGQCNLAFDQAVQAHIELLKSLDFTKCPLMQAQALCELTQLELSMNRIEKAEKWVRQAMTLKGGNKTQCLVKTTQSMFLQAQKHMEQAHRMSDLACSLYPKCGKALAWKGHLLCISGKSAEAEALLEKMTAGSAAAERLMAEITKRA